MAAAQVLGIEGVGLYLVIVAVFFLRMNPPHRPLQVQAAVMVVVSA
jgi:hypothetical protein